jgi:hypothetical protein
VISSNYLGWNVLSGSDVSFWEMHGVVTNYNPLDENFYGLIDGYIDLENLIDYVIAETYYGNGDWYFGWNNTKFWRDESPGGKWRFALMDLDFGMGCAPEDNYIPQAANGDTPTGQIFSRCIENPQFRDQFVNRYADLMNTIFQPEKMEDMIYTMRDELYDAFPRHCQTWYTDCGSIDWAIDVRLAWNDTRIPGMRNVLQDHFVLPNQVDISLDVHPAGAGRIHISTVEPAEDEYPWTGVYYNGIPVRITAIPNPGYVFDHWSANGIFPIDVNIDQFIMNFQESETFDAWFTGSPATDVVEITEFMYNDDSNNETGDWVDIHNKLDIPLNVSGMYFKDQNYFNRFDMPLNTEIPAGGYLVLARDTATFSAEYPNVSNVTGPFDFPLNNDADQLQIFYHTDENVVQVHYTDIAPWPSDTDGSGRTVEFDETEDVQDDPTHWFTGCIGGSPGGPYDPDCLADFVDETGENVAWLVFPNPANDIVNIVLPDQQVDGQLTLTDISGRLIAQHNCMNQAQFQLDVSLLPRGMYTLQYLSTSRGNLVKKLMVD